MKTAQYFEWKSVWYQVTTRANEGDIVEVKSTNVKVVSKEETEDGTILKVELTGSPDGSLDNLFYAEEAQDFQPTTPLST